jgi:hypothetical protein
MIALLPVFSIQCSPSVHISTARLKLFFWIAGRTYGFGSSTISRFFTPIV